MCPTKIKLMQYFLLLSGSKISNPPPPYVLCNARSKDPLVKKKMVRPGYVSKLAFKVENAED